MKTQYHYTKEAQKWVNEKKDESAWYAFKLILVVAVVAAVVCVDWVGAL